MESEILPLLQPIPVQKIQSVQRTFRFQGYETILKACARKQQRRARQVPLYVVDYPKAVDT